MRSISLHPVISLLLFVALFAGFQGGRYIFANRLQEVGALCSLLVFAIGAWVSLFRVTPAEWQKWVFTPCLLIFGIMMTSALTFTMNFNESVIYSFFAAREFLLGFVGPAIVLIVRAGYPLEDLRKVILGCMLALLVNYLYHYNTMDLQAAFFSTDHTISNLVTYDEWRGFRLKPSMVAVMLSLLCGLTLCLQFKSTGSVAFGVLLVLLSCYIWSIVMFRSTLATMLLGIGLYFVFLSARNRLPLIFIALPLSVIILPIGAQIVLDHFLQADGGTLRIKSYQLALNSIPQYFFFGVGEDSAFGKTYQDLFARTFFPSDIGIVGIMFKYGITGLVLYTFMHILIFVKLWRANILVREVTGQHDAILWALLILITAQTLNLVLIAGLAYAQGITTGSLSLALSYLYSQKAIEYSQNEITKLQNASH